MKSEVIRVFHLDSRYHAKTYATVTGHLFVKVSGLKDVLEGTCSSKSADCEQGFTGDSETYWTRITHNGISYWGQSHKGIRLKLLGRTSGGFAPPGLGFGPNGARGSPPIRGEWGLSSLPP